MPSLPGGRASTPDLRSPRPSGARRAEPGAQSHGGGNPHRQTPGAARPTADGADRQETPGKRPGSAVNDRGASRAARRERARLGDAPGPGRGATQPGNFWPPPQRLGAGDRATGPGTGSAPSRAYPENKRLLPCPPPTG